MANVLKVIRVLAQSDKDWEEAAEMALTASKLPDTFAWLYITVFEENMGLGIRATIVIALKTGSRAASRRFCHGPN